MMKSKTFGCAALVALSLTGLPASAENLKQSALKKLDRLEQLMQQAEARSIDVTREETVVWFAKEFIKISDWDEANRQVIENMLGLYYYYKGKEEEMALNLPDFERREVIEMLDRSIHTLEQVLAGKIQRRSAVKVDWANIQTETDQFTSNGKPVFLYDYFSKSMGNPTSDTNLYNDYLGNIDYPECISTHCLKNESEFDVPRVERVTKHPDTRVGFTVLWHMEQPNWVYKDPDVKKGTSLFIGYDIDNPMMRGAWSRILEKVGRDSRGSRTHQMGYMLANEPHWHSNRENWFQTIGEMNTLSKYTRAKFRKWLDAKYGGDLAKLNRNWGTGFNSFDEVEFEFPVSDRLTGKPLYYDWCRFNMDRATDWMASLQGALKKGNPEADTHIKIQPHLFTHDDRAHGIDMEALTELTTMIGDDAKAHGRIHSHNKPQPWEEKYAYTWEELCVSYDFMESVAPEKIHVNSESHFLSVSRWRDLEMEPEYVRNTYWLATLLGMDANLTWFWARDPDGSPEQRLETTKEFTDPALAGSFAGSVNMQPQVANEYTQVMFDLNAFSEEIMLLRRQRRPIRLFHSETSAINKKHHMQEQFELYESLYFEGFPLGYVTEKILQKQDPADWDAVLVYRTEFATDSEFDALQCYLNQGGTVITDGRCLTRNEYGEKRLKTLQAGAGQLIHLGPGAGYQEFKDKALSTVEKSRPTVRLTEDNSTPYKGCIWRVAEAPGGKTILNIINVGRNTAQLKTSFATGGEARCTNMLTGQALGSSFKLESNGVLLLEVEKAGTGH